MENTGASSDTLRSFADSDITTGIENGDSGIDNSRTEKNADASNLRWSKRKRRSTLTQWMASTPLGQRAQGITMKRMKKFLLATISRTLLTIHGIVMIWVLVQVNGNREYWLLSVGLFGLYIEMCITLNVTKKGEWKWFSPSVFMYLCVTIPCIFLSEFKLKHRAKSPSNSTVCPSTSEQEYSLKSDREMLDTMEQLMILVLILGRWIMPKGQMTRDQLAQLLLLYIGLGADILDILQFLKDDQIKDDSVIIAGLSLFSWAILQFTLVLTQSSQPQKKSHHKDIVCASSLCKGCNFSFWTSEVWSLAIAVLMQDGPFLVFRLYLLIQWRLRNKTMIFFICKNILTVIIELYRIIAVWREHRP